MSDVQVQNANGRPTDNQYTELVFPTNIPADLLTHLFTFNDELDTPDWSFDRVFLLLNDESKSVDVMVLSKDQQKQLTARVDKAETYQLLQSYIFAENDLLRENIVFGSENNPIYLPEDEQELPKKTVIASEIDPELFINALFSNPSLVTPNTGEAYFTDGQRGMRIAQDGRRLEFINPLQSNYERLDAIELIEKSVNNIDEHKGWTNNYMFDHVNRATNNIRYRLTYDSYPVFDQNNLSTMEQEWRDQELYQYKRPLIEIGSLLNSENVTLPSGEEVEHWLLQDQDKFNMNEITDIRIGYYLSYADDTHSLTLEPNWFILYENDWIKFDLESVREDNNQRGEG